MHSAYPLAVANRRRGLWPLALLLLVDLLVLAISLTGTTDANAPRSTCIFSALAVVLALFLSGLTLVRLVRRAKEGTKLSA